ncbi:3-dehydroquinate synthase [Streptomyces fumanus]
MTGLNRRRFLLSGSGAAVGAAVTATGPASAARACGADGRTPARCLVVIDDKVDALYGERLRGYLETWRIDASFKVLPGDESAKELASAVEVTEAMTAMGLLRRTEKILAVGGGVVLDIAGFAASLYRRGVPYIRVPTTLLGQVDAGVGVKTGVNHGHHKNRLGTYYAPETALIDPEFLATVEPRHITNGMAEIIKMALVKDAALFRLLESTAAHSTPRSLAASGPAAAEVISGPSPACSTNSNPTCGSGSWSGRSTTATPSAPPWNCGPTRRCCTARPSPSTWPSASPSPICAGCSAPRTPTGRCA